MKVLKHDLKNKIKNFIAAQQKHLEDDDKAIILHKAQEDELKKYGLAQIKAGKGEIEIQTGWKKAITIAVNLPPKFKEVKTLGEWDRKEIECKIKAARNNLEMIDMAPGDTVPVTKSLKLDTYLSF